jgi:sugar phosphate isomerase/epimerase
MRRPGDGGGRVVHMGDGFVDWRTTLKTLKALGFDGPVSFHSEYSGVPIETVIDLARVDVRFIKGLLKEI